MSLPIEKRRRVFLAYDNSEISKNVYQWAKQQIFRPNTDHVILLTITENGEGYVEPGYLQGFLSGKWGFEERQTYLKEASQAAQKVLDELSHELAAHDITSQAIVIKKEHAGEAIVDATKELNADLLILGSRGLHPLKKAFMGSVSSHCIEKCDCPVLVHKGQPPKSKLH